MTNDNCNCNHKPPYAAKHPRRALCCCLAIFLLLAGITLLTLYLVYRPHKPYFTVASVIVLNLTTTTTTSAPPPSVSAAMQFTIITTNPNHRVSILYDRLSAYVSYHNQMITQPVALPPLFHEKHTRVEMAPVLGGAVGGGCGVCGRGGGGGAVPVAPEVAYGLGMDEEYGVVGLSLVLLGKIRWKAAGITTGRYGIYVKCDILIRLRKVFQLLGSMHCYVKVYEGNDNPRRVSKGLSEQKT
ncbi:hypothetical protein RHGRI_001893 [Rhododendron griersonianum]|uniref:Late embryogenesis abundant protein LEA-2 subgroup domain-containing protein n=1 Tax=Rhododendron griersonianum TaxID=479676 RepID=A0AAV6LMB4_9ERIC|nr:hypothetical protein RHGRI_001893 [Rhododendron griersonianum]